MKMILRWFPYGDDSVTLQQIRQTPGVSGIATRSRKFQLAKSGRQSSFLPCATR